ncbi:MAG: hypothetical protein A2W30_03785 [Ignavibacteria bacterium RBG_16_36_9]|nr:MAG: hypothetical protein A2W30_03785 [Ignavibacteria bacterium RBG_16_36_9]
MNESKIEKQTFTYPFLFRIIFRYGNIIITSLLLLYTISLIAFLDEKIILALPLLVNLFLIYFLNRHYFNLYKILPYLIEADDEKIICSKFFLSKKEIVIFYKDVTSLSGGIFENKISGVMKVCDGKNQTCIGFYQRLNNSSRLATILLSKVNRNLYDNVLEKIKSRKGKVKK